MESFSISHFELVYTEEMFTDLEGLWGYRALGNHLDNQEALSC